MGMFIQNNKQNFFDQTTCIGHCCYWNDVSISRNSRIKKKTRFTSLTVSHFMQTLFHCMSVHKCCIWSLHTLVRTIFLILQSQNKLNISTDTADTEPSIYPYFIYSFVVFRILVMVYSSHKSPAFPNVPATNQRPVIMERNPRLPSIDVWSIDEGNIIYSEWFAITTHEENRKFCTNIRFTNARRIEEFWIFPSNWNNRFHKLCVCILQRSNYEMADIVEAMEMKLEMIKGVREVDWTIYTFTFDVSSDWLLKCIIG